MSEDKLREQMTANGQNAIATEAFNAILARTDGLSRLTDLFTGAYGMRYDTAEKLAGAWERSQRNIGNFAYEMQWV